MTRIKTAALLCALLSCVTCAAKPPTAVVVGGQELTLGMPKDDVLRSILEPFAVEQLEPDTYLVTIGEGPDRAPDGSLYFLRGELAAASKHIAHFQEVAAFRALDALFVSILGCTGGVPTRASLETEIKETGERVLRFFSRGNEECSVILHGGVDPDAEQWVRIRRSIFRAGHRP
jgi:hypothetical protein